MFHFHEIQPDKDAILALTELNPVKVRNIYIYGSRVYGNHRPDSDYDVLVTACSLNAHKEFNNGEYNVHIITPDVFEDRLRAHDMQALECIFAPKEAKVQIKTDYASAFELRPKTLAKKALSQAQHSWHQAKMRMYDDDIERGAKSLWHALRILAFASQIIDEGCIYDFGEAGNWFEEIMDCEDLEWRKYEEKWKPLKKNLQKDIKRGVSNHES